MPPSRFVRLDNETIQTRLESILLKRLSRASQIYNLLQFHLRGITDDVGLPAEFHWYNALDLEQACIVAKLVRKVNNKPVTVWIFLAPEKDQREAMMEFSKLVTWDQPNSFNFVEDTIATHLTELCREHGGPSFDPHGYLYSIQIQDALKLDLTDEILRPELTMEPLKIEEIPTIMKHWQFAGDQEIDEVLGCVRNLPSAGLHVEGKLVSWAFTGIDGGIHAVFTLPEYRGRGYSPILLRHLCRKSAEEGLIPVVHAEATNDVSNSVMKKVGFKLSHGVTWLNL